MNTMRFGLLFLLFVSLALLPASALAPVEAQGSIQKVILKGEPLPPLGLSDAFSPADVNDGGMVVFYGRDVSSFCGVFVGTPGGPVSDVVTDGFPATEGSLYMCNSLGEAPLTNIVAEVAFAANVGSLGGARAIYVSLAPGSATKVVVQGETAPDGGQFGVPTLLDFNDSGAVLFHATVGAPSPYPEALFLGGGGGGATKVVAVNETLTEAGGGTVTALGDASMNNPGDIVYKADLSDNTNGDEGILLVSGGSTTWVVGENTEWKLGEAYSGGEEHKGHDRFVDTFTSVSGPRINDYDQVSYYATTASGEEGFFIATPGSEYEQAKEGSKDDASAVGLNGFNDFGGPGRHNLDNGGNIVNTGSGGDPVEGVLVFPWFETVAIDGEDILSDTDTYLGFTQPAISESGDQVAFQAGTGSGLDGVFGGSIDISDQDGDTILDKWEQDGGWDYNNDDTVDLDLYGMGARPNHKDIFVEVDWMDCTQGTSDCDDGDTHNHKPTAGIIEDPGPNWGPCDDGLDNGSDGPADTADEDCAVVAAFDNAPVSNPGAEGDGIHLHVLIDDALVHSRFMNFAGSLLEDPDSTTPGSCADGQDNGNDNTCDFGGCPGIGVPLADPDCTGALVNEDPDSATPGACNDGSDNGGDGLCDINGCAAMAADTDCVPIAFHNVRSFGTQDERDDDNSDKILAAKARVFYYAIFGHSAYPDNTATPLWEDTISGYGEIPGNEFMVTLGEWAFTADQQEGTFMHELGHNLGLDHGGSDSMNHKPNYLSVMNYTFQMSNVVDDRPLDYSRWVLPPPDNEDDAGAGTCNDGFDNGSDGVADGNDPDCSGSLLEQAPIEDPGANSGPCDDDVDNGNDGKTDEQDPDCQGGLDEGRGIDSDMTPAPTGLSGLTTAYTYLRPRFGGMADCPFATAAAVGDIDWDMNGSYTGISLGSANTGGGIADPDSGPAPPDQTKCSNPSANLVGFDDWSNLKYLKGFALSPDASVDDDHFTPHPEPGMMAPLPAAPVGGMAEPAEVAESAGSSARDYAALGAVVAAALVVLSAGAWYARRRWIA